MGKQQDWSLYNIFDRFRYHTIKKCYYWLDTDTRIPAAHPPSWGSPAQPKFKANKLVTQCPLAGPEGISLRGWGRPGQVVQSSRCVCMFAFVCVRLCVL